MKLNHEVVIQGADNGVIVRVGCKTLVFDDSKVDEFIGDLRKLINGGESALREKYYPEEMKMKTAGIGTLNMRTPLVDEGCGIAQTECAPQVGRY